MTFEGLLKYPLIFAVALMTSYLLTPICLKIARTIKMVDLPGDRRLNSTAIPRGGGVAVFVALHLAAAIIFLSPWPRAFGGSIDANWWLTLLSSSTILLAVGLLDDKLNINWSLKLAGQLLAALLVYQGGIRFDSLLGKPLPDWLDLILTVGWFLAFINAFNLIDGLDGLASGLAAIAALGLGAAAMFRNMPTDALLLFALAGACLGFLRYNFHPAKIFLGDSGSMVIGFTIAALGLEGSSKGTTIVAICVPFLAIGVPIFDVILAVWRRSLKALISKDKMVGKVVQADMEHVHHRLLKSGLTQRKVALFLYAINAALVTFGTLTVVFNSRATGIFILAIVCCTYVVVKHLAHFELWDSGSAILAGMRRPGRRMIPAIAYPIFDAGFLVLSLSLTIFLVFSPISFAGFKEALTERMPVWCGVPFILLAISGAYSRVWSRARPSEFGLLGLTVIAAIALCMAVRLIVDPGYTIRTVLIAICHGGMSMGLIVGLRTLPRLVQDFMILSVDPRNAGSTKGTLVYGAGSRGMLYLRQLSYRAGEHDAAERIIGFLDDDLALRKRKVHGYRVYGGWEDLTATIEALKPSKLVVTCTLDDARIRKLIEYCSSRQIRLIEWKPQESVLSEGLTERPEQHGPECSLISA